MDQLPFCHHKSHSIHNNHTSVKPTHTTHFLLSSFLRSLLLLLNLRFDGGNVNAVPIGSSSGAAKPIIREASPWWCGEVIVVHVHISVFAHFSITSGSQIAVQILNARRLEEAGLHLPRLRVFLSRFPSSSLRFRQLTSVLEC